MFPLSSEALVIIIISTISSSSTQNVIALLFPLQPPPHPMCVEFK